MNEAGTQFCRLDGWSGKQVESVLPRIIFGKAFGFSGCSLKIELCDRIDGKQEPSKRSWSKMLIWDQGRTSFKIANKVSRNEV